MQFWKLFLILCLAFIVSPLMAQVRELGALRFDGIPEIPDRIPARMQQYQSMRSAGFVDWNPFGGGMVIATRFGETSQLHYVEWPGGARTQITFYKEPVGGASYCPDPQNKGLLITMDVGGGEFYQLFFLDFATGKTTLLTDGQARNTDPIFSPDGKTIVYSSNLRSGADVDIRTLSLANPGQSEIVYQGQGHWGAMDWHQDKLLLYNYISINESYIYVYDMTKKALIPINPQEGKKISYGGALWGKDGKGVFYTSDEIGEFQELFYYELENGNKTRLTSHIPWDISELAMSQDGKKLAYIANEDAVSKLHVLDLATKQELHIPQPPLGVIGGISFNEDSTDLAFTVNAANIPGDVYTVRLTTGELIRWTYSEAGGLKAENFIAPQLIHFPSFDGLQIPAFYYRPKNATGKTPVVISIHGGPESQEFPTFSITYQYLATELGVAVIAPNVRGSAGYGKTYLLKDNWLQRMDSVKDIGALLDWIEKQPELDPAKVAVFGGSYGGFMVLASMYMYNDRICAGVDVVGISNIYTFLINTQEYRRDLRRVEYGDERVPEVQKFLIETAPTTNAHKITKPLLVVQGANDPRVPASEAEQIVEIVRKNGGDVWYLLAANEGHGFRKKSNRDQYLNCMMFFWEKFLFQK